jgi:hypothetical protein
MLHLLFSLLQEHATGSLLLLDGRNCLHFVWNTKNLQLILRPRHTMYNVKVKVNCWVYSTQVVSNIQRGGAFDVHG